MVNKQSVCIVGGGLAGLCTAFFLRQANPRLGIHLFESSPRLGGWIQSIRHDDGSVFELGPRSIRVPTSNSIYLLHIAEQLGLTKSIIHVAFHEDAAKRRFLSINNKLCELKPFSLLTQPPFSRPLWWFAAQHLFHRPPTLSTNDENHSMSVYDFFRTRLGNEIADYLCDAMIRGIYAGDARQLDIRCVFPQLVELENNSRNFLLGYLKSIIFSSKITKMEKENFSNSNNSITSELHRQAIENHWSVWSLQGGLQTLVDAITDKLQSDPNIHLHVNRPVDKITSKSQEGNIIQTKDGESLQSQHVFLSTPLHRLANLLTNNNNNHHHQQLQEEEVISKLIESLNSTAPYVTVAVVCLEYQGNLLLKRPGFGHLIPSQTTNQPHVLGVVYDSCIFPQLNCQQEKRTRFTVMLGGAWFSPHCNTLTNNQLLQLAHETIIKQCEFQFDSTTTIQQPIRSWIQLQENCIPQYGFGHYQKVHELRKHLTKWNPNISLVGCSFDGVSVNDVATSAFTAVRMYLSKINQ